MIADKIKDYEEVERAKKILGRCLSTPETCLRVLEKLVSYIVVPSNPVWIAAEQEFNRLVRNKKGDRIFGYKEKYKILRGRAELFEGRAPENFCGEYSWKRGYGAGDIIFMRDLSKHSFEYSDFQLLGVA